MRRVSIFVASLALLAYAPARAQLMLPGFQSQPPEAPTAPATPAPNPPKPAAKKPKVSGLKSPPVATIVGRELSRNGSRGTILFQNAADKRIEIAKLSLAGEETSDPPGPCLVDVVAEEPVQAKFAGHPNGLARYDVDIKACPFSFEILNGAILITRSPETCEFTAAQCRVDLAGLWGPPGKSMGPEQAKQFERERGRAETEMRAKFRALLATAGKDKDAVKKIAEEQAGFSSAREITCHGYLDENVHGFCALRLTQARTAALQAALLKAAAKPGSNPAKALERKAATKPDPTAHLTPAPPSPNPAPGPGPAPN